MWVEENNLDEIVIHAAAGEPVQTTIADRVIIEDTEGRTNDIAYTAITVNNPRIKIELNSAALTWAQIPNSLRRLICKFTNKEGHTIEKVEEWK